MNTKNKALLTAIVSVVFLLGASAGIVALINKFPLATGLSVLGVATYLFGRSIYVKELSRLNSEDAKSQEA